MSTVVVEYRLLPEGLRDGMRRYIEHGILPGDFLQAVLRNDLVDAVLRADATSAHTMYGIACFMNGEAPETCWGSREKMEAWAKARRAEAEQR